MLKLITGLQQRDSHLTFINVRFSCDFASLRAAAEPWLKLLENLKIYLAIYNSTISLSKAIYKLFCKSEALLYIHIGCVFLKKISQSILNILI